MTGRVLQAPVRSAYLVSQMSDLLQPQKPKRGRPATGKGTPVQVRMQDSLLGKLDRWREAQPDEPTRPEAARRIIDEALKDEP